MDLTWRKELGRLTGEGLGYPYSHWWRDHEAQAQAARSQGKVDAEKQQRAFNRLVTDVGKFSNIDDSRIQDILESFPFDTAMPALLDAVAIKAVGPEDPDPTDETAPAFTELDTTLRRGDSIVAAIDDGAFFAHQMLHDPRDGISLDWVWLQGAPHAAGNELVCGRELQRGEIKELISQHRKPSGLVDEEALYREVGLIDMTGGSPQSAARRQSHGMGVMDMLIADRDPATARRQRRHRAGRVHVLWVSLPPRVTHDTSGTFIPFFVLLALHELFKRIAELVDRDSSLAVPVVINMSYGLTAGPKDGTGLLGRYVEEQLALWDAARAHAQISFFVPVGNTRLTQSRARVEAGTTSPLYWHLAPDDPTPSFAEVWGPRRDARPDRPSLGLGVLPPGVAEMLRAPVPEIFDSFADLSDDSSNVAMRCYWRWVPASLKAPDGPGRECMVLAAQPTRPGGPNDVFIRPGRWQIEVASDAGLPLDFYVQRDDSLPGYPRRGRQSWLEDNQYVRRDPAGRLLIQDPTQPGPVRREGTFNAIAAGPLVRFVEGLRLGPSGPGAVAAFSALGPGHFAELAEGTPAWPWLTVAGARSGSRAQVRGTSFAAPQAARKMALTPVADTSSSNV
ncbi:hypothetical protein [Cognatiyoonia sp. IB215182]|uniref:hypothetical protein n=1 Tax=Cognatiyoonia sp. IB215182 TaxID=3097353 RepID=UPI002A15870B|nr:hypothetical protein [Cognatiyoonia sp. IB215182]MDX8355786.1 hypothetical protein [Cognatiyoonia sp. IB215182]